MTLKTQATKAKINRWDCIKLKICTEKEIINKEKKQLTKWANICTKHISVKRLISKYMSPTIQE